MMKTLLIDEQLTYDGSQLANHWIYSNYGLLGDAVAAFTGPCDVPLDKMVDLEDVLNDDYIFSTDMLHFVLEVFGVSLIEGVMLQRLFVGILAEKINQQMPDKSVSRHGDDLFYKDTQKLSVSICTVTPTSIIIHTGLNIVAKDAPVEAAGLISDLGITGITELATSAMNAMASEWKDIRLSTCKVKAVR